MEQVLRENTSERRFQSFLMTHLRRNCTTSGQCRPVRRLASLVSPTHPGDRHSHRARRAEAGMCFASFWSEGTRMVSIRHRAWSGRRPRPQPLSLEFIFRGQSGQRDYISRSRIDHGVIGLLACLIPAWRALRVNPLVATLRIVIEPARIVLQNNHEVAPGRYVLYWMQQSQRAVCDHALEYAVTRSNECKLPLLVCFGLTMVTRKRTCAITHSCSRSARCRAALKKRGIGFVLQRRDPAEVALALGRRASLIVCDRGYLRVQKEWRLRVGKEARLRGRAGGKRRGRAGGCGFGQARIRGADACDLSNEVLARISATSAKMTAEDGNGVASYRAAKTGDKPQLLVRQLAARPFRHSRVETFSRRDTPGREDLPRFCREGLRNYTRREISRRPITSPT